MEDLHLSQIVPFQSKKYQQKPFLFSKKDASKHWESITWHDFNEQVNVVAKALIEFEVKEFDRVGQFSQNLAENLIVDFGLYANRAVLVPLYATSSVSQVEFIVNDAEIRVMFVGEQMQYDVACEVMKTSKFLKQIIIFDSNVVVNPHFNSVFYTDFLVKGRNSSKHFEVIQRTDDASENDLACVLYTSGTTGNPKGVMMPHSCYMEAMRIHKVRLTSVTDTDVSIAFLPLSHVFERTWCYFCMYSGVSIYVNLRPMEIQQTIKEIRPTLMCAVPRFWEKVYAGVQDNISKMSPFKMGMVTWALAVGKIYNLDYMRIGKKPNVILQIKYAIADKLIFSKVKKTIGLDNANILPTAGAKLSDEINTFMRSIGVPIVYGYGLTESTATVSCFSYVNFKISTVGSIMPDVQVKIGEDSEILLKGKTIFPGYYMNEAATIAAFTEDGWFKTGDAGFLEGNQIVLTERIKDLFKTSNGKYIAPQAIETLLALDKYIEQVAAIGDERNFVTAIIVPSMPAILEYAEKKKIIFESEDELLKTPEIYSLIEGRIKELQKGMANYEQIKKFSLIRKGFSIETGELTNTLKIRRAVIMQSYRSIIDEMYV
jgi:long-chain acyl-CoA synthetase